MVDIKWFLIGRCKFDFQHTKNLVIGNKELIRKMSKTREEMIKSPTSIFNDVLGPVMNGPSSSHTAGPTRIGKAISNIVGKEISKIEIIFKEDGSYPATYIGQGSDKGFIGGLMGFNPEDERLPNSLEIARERGIDFKFKKDRIDISHPNTAKILIEDIDGLSQEFLTLSTGGGMYEIIQIDGHEVSVKGGLNEVFLKTTLEDEIDKVIAPLNVKVSKLKGSEETFYHFSSEENLPSLVLDSLRERSLWMRTLEKNLPVGCKFEYNLPFVTAEEALEFNRNKNLSPVDLAIEYEVARSGHSREEVIDQMKKIVLIMKEAARKGMEGGFETKGFLTPKAKLMNESLKKRKIADLGIMNKGMIIATAIMEYNSSMGIVVAAPTAGSCGVLPGVVLAMEEEGYSLDEMAEGMLVAGLIGVFISHQSTFSAEVCACQAENGSASAMAAAAIVQMLGGNVEEAFNAAGVALQNVLGLICDPIGGLVDLPCVNRNSMAASNAIVSANMIVTGFDPMIPLDEVIKSMWDVGNMLPRELRCTGLGGLCVTKTGLKIGKELAEKRVSL